MLDAFFDPTGAPAPRSPLGEVGHPRRLLPGGVDAPGVSIAETPPPGLWRIEARAGRTQAVAAALGTGDAPAPGPGRWTGDDARACLRIAPRVWWVAAAEAPAVGREDATPIDLGHAYARLRMGGPARRDLVARLVPLDARERATPAGTLATAPYHGVAVTLAWEADTLDLWLPRSRARALAAAIVETAAQFGVEVT